MASKRYLKQKISAAVILFWILCGFSLGSGIGSAIFRNTQSNLITFTMVYSSEKSAWITEAALLFNSYWEDQRRENVSLKPINLDFQPYGSGDMLISLLNNEIKPVIWSPASNIWIPLLNAKWKQLYDTEINVVENYSRFIYSPIVIATWETFLQNYPFNGFLDLHDLIVSNPGLIKMAHTDPRESNSGFMATIMMVNAYLHMNSQLITMENISNSALITWMREIQQSAIFYGKSTGFLGKYMLDQGPSALTLAVLYENLVQDYSQSALEQWGQKIVAVYPEEGMLYSDHPFCILNAEWVSPEQKYIASEFLRFLNTPVMIGKAIQTGFRPINADILDNALIYDIYLQSFNEDHGVFSNESQFIEIFPPLDGNVIARIPDLWLKTRNSA